MCTNVLPYSGFPPNSVLPKIQSQVLSVVPHFSHFFFTRGNAPTSSYLPWATPSIIPVSSDCHGDGIYDLALFDPTTNLWWIRSIGAIPPTIAGGVPWGFAGAIPVPGDFDGDGISDLAVWDTATGNWYVRRIGPGPAILNPLNWGSPGFMPVLP